ncbi:hypothetical protein ACQPZX_13215 [Actinoplanes sp. CA-142083]|uniref:hypothetical protein n=1 Tax=Actinoplanes sp. CA-142083 TaxID=3239903 RepID=UPI003D9032F4
MERISIDHEDVVGADYSGRSLDKFSAQGSTFTDCKFDRVKVGDASFGAGTEQSLYVGCSFDRASLTSLVGYVRFVGCTFRNARFVRPGADYLEFVDCSFTGRTTGLELRGAPHGAQNRYEATLRGLARQGKPEPPGYRELALRPSNQIHGNDFAGAELVGVSFRFGVDLTAQKLPTGDDYLYLPDAAAAVRRAVAAAEQEPSELAGKAKFFLEDVLQREIDYGQRQLLLRPKNYERSKVVPPHILLAVELLKR